jgi:hypothetical protein
MPELCQKFPYPPIGGRGEAGRPMRPIAACAIIVVERTRVSQVTPESPGTPRAMVYSLYRALPGDRAFLPPSPALLSANLTPASGRQDHTSLPSASVPFVIGTSASTASRPAAVTIACRPSLGTGRELHSLILVSEKQKYFFQRDWTAQITLIYFKKIAFMRKPFAPWPAARIGRLAIWEG